MTQPLPWAFEPCSPEAATDPSGTPWTHAVRGRKPAGRLVIGYGHTERTANEEARNKAQQHDAREMLGQRGEVVAQLRITIRNVDMYQTMLTVYDDATGDALIQGQLVATDFYSPPMPFVLSSGVPSWNTVDVWPRLDMMPIGT